MEDDSTYTGFDEDENDSSEDNDSSPPARYPKFRIVYQTTNYHLPQIDDLLSKGDIVNIRPEYQRRLRWDSKKKSALIESFLLNIPIPPVFFYESDFAQYEVMDGQQRLNCIREFYQNSFKLTGLKQLPELNGSRRTDLDEKIRRTLDRASIAAIVLLAESAENKDQSKTIRKEVFERLNTGGQKLNAQEIRNAIYAGNFNDMIIELTREPLFTEIWGIPPYTENTKGDYYDNPRRQKNVLYRTMGDCQIVLRFFALQDPEQIKGSMQKVLNNTAETGMSFAKEKCAELKNHYMKCLDAAVKIGGKEPFDVVSPTGTAKRSIPFQDALMCGLGRLNEAERSQLLANTKVAKKDLSDFTGNPANYDILVGRANTAEDTKDRIAKVHNILKSSIQ
ncbi:DUF262 domain-containing protein [Hyphomonas sp. UBA4494]|jgi:hypothetical protein|uniref:DUF262 domain-containing protein n=1 Tax=Hyphomonas sp. UBA4494 TaxID=1946631 RepID=UPI0025C1488B|nr:DUF262 domain-containing protein [Hyphomonas sp. UBA4494]